MFISCGWPKVPDAPCDERDVALQVAQTIESGVTTEASDAVASGLTVILRDTGIATQQRDAEQILGRQTFAGRTPSKRMRFSSPRSR